jgi:hypothetical protein
MITQYDWRPGHERRLLTPRRLGKSGKVLAPTKKGITGDISIGLEKALGWDTFRELHNQGRLIGEALIDAEKAYGKTEGNSRREGSED